MAAKYEMAAVKGCWLFSIWVKVEGVPGPVHNIVNAKEGPEAWIAVEEDREYTIHYSIRKLADKGDQCFLEEYPDFEISCVADGDMLDVDSSRFEEIARGEAEGNFEATYSEPKKANLDRMGTIEVSFQRSDASHPHACPKKDSLPSKRLNEREAAENNVDMVTSFGPIVPTTKPVWTSAGVTAPIDAGDFVSMQFRYVSKKTMSALGYMQEDIPDVPPSPVQQSRPKSKKVAAPSTRAKKRPVATQKKVVTPVREMSEEAPPPVIAEVPQVVQGVPGVIEAIAKMHKTLMDTLSDLHRAKAAEIATEYVRLLNLSLATGCMKPSLKTKLRIVQAAINSNASMARYGPANEEEMAEDVFTMNELLQDKAKELQKVPNSKNAARLEEFRGMSNALQVIIGSMQEALESVENQQQDASREHSPELMQDDDRFRASF